MENYRRNSHPQEKRIETARRAAASRDQSKRRVKDAAHINVNQGLEGLKTAKARK